MKKKHKGDLTAESFAINALFLSRINNNVRNYIVSSVEEPED